MKSSAHNGKEKNNMSKKRIRQSSWRDATKELPKDGEYVMILINYTYSRPSVYIIYYKDKKWMFNPNIPESCIAETPSFWTYLPSCINVPKEEAC